MHIYTCEEAKIEYDNLIEANQFTPKIKFQTARHHIIPKSLGGSNDQSNLVNLYHKDHFIAHYLLYKIYNDYKMTYAFYRMSSQITNINSDLLREKSIEFQIIQEKFSLLQKEKTTLTRKVKTWNSTKGRKFSDLHKQKLSKAKQGLKFSSEGKAKLNRKNSKNNNAKKYSIISPNNEQYLIHGTIQLFCQEHFLSYSVIRYNLNKGPIKITKNKNSNCIGWSFFEIK